MGKIPMKMRAIEWLKENPVSSVEDLMEGLKGEYGTEGQFSISNFKHMVAAMKAVGIIENSKVELDKNENVIVRYSLTNYGVKSMKHIPGYR